MSLSSTAALAVLSSDYLPAVVREDQIFARNRRCITGRRYALREGITIEFHAPSIELGVGMDGQCVYEKRNSNVSNRFGNQAETAEA